MDGRFQSLISHIEQQFACFLGVTSEQKGSIRVLYSVHSSTCKQSCTISISLQIPYQLFCFPSYQSKCYKRVRSPTFRCDEPELWRWTRLAADPQLRPASDDVQRFQMLRSQHLAVDAKWGCPQTLLFIRRRITVGWTRLFLQSASWGRLHGSHPEKNSKNYPQYKILQKNNSNRSHKF